MFEKIKKQPVLQIVLLALLIIIVISVFTPREGRLTAGISVGGHVGSLRGGFNLETTEIKVLLPFSTLIGVDTVKD